MYKKFLSIVAIFILSILLILPNQIVDSASFNQRLAGQTRYETAAKIAQEGWTSSNYAVVASGEGFADALSAAPLAKKYNAPILLTGKNTLDSNTKSELQSLGVKNVFLIGGTGSISDNVKSELGSMNIIVTRISGKDRFETSLEVAKNLGDINGIVVTNAYGFADALSIAPIAADQGMAVILTSSDSLSSDIQTFLNSINYSKSYIIGGTGVVGHSVASQLKNVTRLSGASRYETNAAVLKQFADNLSYDKVYVASGENYPDALSGSVLAASNNSPLILVGNSFDPSVISSIQAQHDKYNDVVVLGGAAVVSDALINDIVSGVFIPSISDEEIKKLIYNADQAYVKIHLLASYDKNDAIYTDNAYYKLKDNVNTYDKLFKYYNVYFSEKKSNYFINSGLFVNSNNTFYILGCDPGARSLILEAKLENKTIDKNKMNVTLLCYNEEGVFPNEEYPPEYENYTLIYEDGRWVMDDCDNSDWNDFNYRDNHNLNQ